MKTSSNSPDTSLNFSSRESLLRANADLISQLQKRLHSKRFRPQEGDSVKLGYIRALIQAIQTQNAVLKDIELDELKKEISELKEGLSCQSKL